MSQSVTKAIIPVAGFGTRFLPLTKSQPKEMLPVADKPVIQYVVEAAVASGIKDIIFVTSQSKRNIEDYFDYNRELEAWLLKTSKKEALKEIRRVAELANFIYIRQKGPYGTGTPILNAANIIGNEPFAVLYGDDLFVNRRKPILKQLIDAYEKYQNPMIVAYGVDKKEVKKYGIIDGQRVEKNILKINFIVEKPEIKEAPSAIASIGNYILTPDIFEILKNTPIDKRGELSLADAISILSRKRPLFACQIEGQYYDIGSKIGWLKANIDFALKNKELNQELKKYFKSVI